jgi:hypothetical protein
VDGPELQDGLVLSWRGNMVLGLYLELRVVNHLHIVGGKQAVVAIRTQALKYRHTMSRIRNSISFYMDPAFLFFSLLETHLIADKLDSEQPVCHEYQLLTAVSILADFLQRIPRFFIRTLPPRILIGQYL